MNEEKKAFIEGEKAFNKGLGISDNPYVPKETGTDYKLSYQWQKGYEKAKNKQKINK